MAADDLLSYALTTQQRVADFGGLGTITAGSSTDTVLKRLINQASVFIENYTSRRFKQTAYTQEEYDGDGTDVLFLKNWPISTSGFTLEVRTSGENEDDWDSEDSDEYFIYTTEGYIKFIRGRKFISSPKKYRVTYTAGYEYDNSSTYLSDTDAADIEYVAIKLVLTLYNKRKGETGVKSEAIGDYRIEYLDSLFSSPELRSILDKYKKVRQFTYTTPPNT